MLAGFAARLFYSVAQARAALFSVFLFIPHGLLKSLAMKKVDLHDEDSEEEDMGTEGELSCSAQSAPCAALIPAQT